MPCEHLGAAGLNVLLHALEICAIELVPHGLTPCFCCKSGAWRMCSVLRLACALKYLSLFKVNKPLNRFRRSARMLTACGGAKGSELGPCASTPSTPDVRGPLQRLRPGENAGLPLRPANLWSNR